MVSTIILGGCTLIHILAEDSPSCGVSYPKAAISTHTATLIAAHSIGTGCVLSTQPWHRAALIHIQAGGDWCAVAEVPREALTQIPT